MTRPEFAGVMAYLEAGCGKPCPPEAAHVYFDLLGDLDVKVLLNAARRVILQHPWATFPSIAELRQAAAETAQGRVSPLSPAEAWALAWCAIGKIDPEQPGSIARHCAPLPPLVVEAMQALGVEALCHGREPVAVVRAHFLKAFEQLAARETRRALLPPALQREVIALTDRPAALTQALASVGLEHKGQPQ